MANKTKDILTPGTGIFRTATRRTSPIPQSKLVKQKTLFDAQTGKRLSSGRFSQFFNKLPLTETANVLGSLSAAFSGDNAAGRVGASVRDRTAQRLFTDFVGKAAEAINLGENPSRIASFGLTPEQRTAAINEARTQPIFEAEKGFRERELGIKEGDALDRAINRKLRIDLQESTLEFEQARETRLKNLAGFNRIDTFTKLIDSGLQRNMVSILSTFGVEELSDIIDDRQRRLAGMRIRSANRRFLSQQLPGLLRMADKNITQEEIDALSGKVEARQSILDTFDDEVETSKFVLPPSEEKIVKQPKLSQLSSRERQSLTGQGFLITLESKEEALTKIEAQIKKLQQPRTTGLLSGLPPQATNRKQIEQLQQSALAIRESIENDTPAPPAPSRIFGDLFLTPLQRKIKQQAGTSIFDISSDTPIEEIKAAPIGTIIIGKGIKYEKTGENAFNEVK